ncbi:helix-turn-helix transcriptional regulator [Streptomyces sp. NRRL S-646]|uniref:helix-turn-helix transcriptional regulator n=1 Tax=Streptomyces sp. NRRL S-646 TaxID=1463917 RepID=UPI00068B4700|nr:LuxR C-terminal-related transcriptional regulator [Streptomyces sp. NRRL S-646]
MLTQSPVAIATWKTDRSLAVSVMAGSAWRIGLSRGDHVTMLTGRDPDLADCLGRAHRLALSGRTISLEVGGDTQLWKVVLSPDRAADGTVAGVIGAAWHMPATTEPADPAALRTSDEDTPFVPSPSATTWSADEMDLKLSRLPIPLLKVSAQGVVVHLNPAAADLFGCAAPDELAGRPLSRLTRGRPPRADGGDGDRVRFVRADDSDFLACCTWIPWPEEGAQHLVVLHDEVETPATEKAGRPADKPTLTPTEATILELTAQGLTSMQIANRLHFSVNNVEYHLANLRLRLDSVNRVALVARAYACGLLRRGCWPPTAVAPTGRRRDAEPEVLRPAKRCG